MRSVVLGAGGFLGLNLVDALCAAGETPRCGARRPSPQLARRGVPVVYADNDDPVSLVAAMRGRDVVYHLAGHYPRLSLDGDASTSRGLHELERVLDAAAEAGVGRVVYVSSTATVAPAEGRPSTEADVFARRPGFGVYHDLKWATEQRALAETRVDVVVACPAGCVGPWDLRLGTSGLVVAVARGWPLPHPDGIVDVVDVRDVALGLLAQGSMPSPPRRVLLCARWFGLHDLLVGLARRYGAPEPSSPLCADAARALADEEERRVDRTGGRPLLSREIVDLVVHGVPIDASWSARALGLTWTPWEETLSAFEAWARRFSLLNRPSRTVHDSL